MSIKKYLKFTGTMKLLSDTRIGGSTDETKVGGCDNPVIKNSITGEPYIPGSSLKGVMRCIEESRPSYAAKIKMGKPCGCGDSNCMVCKIFGAHMNTNPKSGIPRLQVHNMYINQEFKDSLLRSGEVLTSVVDTKTSTMIDRSTGMAARNSLRNMEVISAGVVFDVQFVLKVLDTDDEAALIKELQFILNRIEVQGIGSKTSSGCGQVEFDIDFDDPKEFKM